MIEKKVVWTTAKVLETTKKMDEGVILPNYLIPFFDKNPDLRKAKISFMFTGNELDEYTKCKLDVTYFANTYCYVKSEDGKFKPIRLRDYQYDMLELYDNNSKSILMASRQVGKTVSAGIYILHFMLFNNTKNVLLAANKLETAAEVLDKIKEIYKYLPFFLKQGIEVWNTRQIKFENTSRAKAFAMTKSSSIGNTGDLVYLDEFAHIPDNIANHFYKSIFPTLASIENSKIIITSTPNGPNLFMNLLLNAELSEDDMEKNEFQALRVYWHQVPGRNVTLLKLYDKKLHRFEIDKEMILEQCINRFNPNGEFTTPNDDALIILKKDPNNGRSIINLNNYHGVTTDKVRDMVFINRDGKEIPLSLIGQVSTWKLDAVKNIGGEDNFNQEYDLRFTKGVNSILSESLVEWLASNKVKFENQMGVHPFDKLRYDMSGLVFNPRIEISQIRNHYCLVTVDPSEGLGNDYSVINVFKLEYKDIEYIKENMDIYTSAYDLISLKQVMKYRSNTISPEKLAEVLHLILFNFLNTEKTKCTIEYNNDGKTVLACLKHVFGDKNEYAAHVMMRFLHRLDATVKNIGLKVHSNKNQLVKDYQEAMESRAVVIEDENTIKESNHFIKHITNSGNTTYKAEGSMNDDDIITVVQAGHTFKNKVFRAHMDEFMEQNPNKEINALLDIIMKRDKELYKQGTDYVGLVNAINRGNNKLGTTQQLDITKLF